MNVEYGYINTLKPTGLHDLAPLRAVQEMIVLVMNTPQVLALMGAGAERLFARQMKHCAKHLTKSLHHNFSLRFQMWVRSDIERIKWVRSIIGEAAIRKWRIRSQAEYLVQIMLDIRDEARQKSIDAGEGFIDPLKAFIGEQPYYHDPRASHEFMENGGHPAPEHTKPRQKTMWKPFALARLNTGPLALPINIVPPMPPMLPMPPMPTRPIAGTAKGQKRGKRNFQPIRFYPDELRTDMPAIMAKRAADPIRPTAEYSYEQTATGTHQPTENSPPQDHDPR